MEIKLLKPCSEDINQMPCVANDLRFCKSCNKNIHDFRSKSSQEITNIFSKEKNVCGVFDFARPLNNKEKQHHISLAKFALSLMLVFGSNLYANAHEAVPELNQLKQVISSSKPVPTIVMVGKLENKGYTSITVIYKDSILTTIQADENGKFKLELPDNYKGEVVQLEIDYVYNPIFLKIEPNNALSLKFHKKKLKHTPFMGVPARMDDF